MKEVFTYASYGALVVAGLSLVADPSGTLSMVGDGAQKLVNVIT